MVIKRVSFDGGKTHFIAPSWGQMGKLCFDLSKKVLRNGKEYDRVVAVAKGGLTWARPIVDYLRIVKLDSIQMRLYRGINKTFKKPEIFFSINGDVEGESILLFDDVADTGDTLDYAKEKLLELGAKEVETATLFYKPGSKLIPDYFEHETDAWIVFPYEIREFIEETSGEWHSLGVSKKALSERYKRLGLPEDEVQYFISKIP